MKIELERECARLQPRLNYIKVVERKHGKTYGLYCVHSMFNKYTCDVGDFCPTLATFIPSNLSRLRTGMVSRIGVWGTGEYASGAWYEVSK